MALSGFLVFTDKTQANILNNFPQADLLINIARLCFGLNMCAWYIQLSDMRLTDFQLSEQVYYAPARGLRLPRGTSRRSHFASTLQIVTEPCREPKVIESYFYPDEPFSQKRHYIVTTAIVFSTMTISLLTCGQSLCLVIWYSGPEG